MTSPESLKLRVLQAARQRPAPRRPDRLPLTAGLAVLAAAMMFAVFQWGPHLFGDVGGLAHTVGRPAASGLGIVGGIAVLALASTWYLSPLRRSMLSPARGLLLGVAIGVPLLVGAWLMLGTRPRKTPSPAAGGDASP